jgi:LacI family transcriptional regulator
MKDIALSVFRIYNKKPNTTHVKKTDAKKRKKIVMKDVAEKANVSMATVSYVLNGRAAELHIDPETQKNVAATAKKLGYCLPSSVGRGGRQIGVIFPNVKGEYMARLLTGIQEVLRENEYHAVFSVCHDDPESEQQDMQMCKRRRVSGILAFPCDDELALQRWSPFLKDAPPTVFLGRTPNNITGATTVLQDNVSIGREAAEVLLRENCSTFIIISDDNVDPEVLNLRRKGFLEHLKEKQQTLKEYCWRDHPDILNELSSSPPGTGVFGVRDNLLFPTLYYASRQQINLPADTVYATVGHVEGAYPIPNRCWVAEIPSLEMGREAAHLLLSNLDKPGSQTSDRILPVSWKQNLLLEQTLHTLVDVRN